MMLPRTSTKNWKLKGAKPTTLQGVCGKRNLAKQPPFPALSTRFAE
jgi:hypothetical protein